ncbi:GNAT family N-acetyltransferase [Flavimaribacter sediminis]|uniref:GNAT family N-acetyltransferase n=1 Tax=Flavimaribacter sediminis TaxID=2865987 RepID=UPI00215D8563|nr:GNAT family N-acetyltransferase [Flavimaribacter sediminis]
MPEIRELIVETWHDAYDPLYGAAEVERMTSEWSSIERLRQDMARPDSEFIVADTGEAIAGMAYAASSDEGRTVLLYQICVLPRFQARGAGSALLDELGGCFPQARSMRLHVEHANSKAIEFFRRRGFVRTGKAASLDEGGGSGQSLEFEKSL